MSTDSEAGESSMKEDKQYFDHKITKVGKEKTGWTIKLDDGFSFYVPETSPIEPQIGMTARMYGAGLGARVRGLLLDGVVVYYRTAAEDEEAHEIEMYGADAADWLKRWDEGESVWSIEMGGIGPGYEQCIHITTAEIIRLMLEKNMVAHAWEDGDVWKTDLRIIEYECFNNPTIKSLGLTGAQWHGAVNLACQFYKQGPRGVLKDKRIKDRRILVSKNFPTTATGWNTKVEGR